MNKVQRGSGFVGTALGVKTDGAAAARAKQPSLGQADVVFLWEGGLFSRGLNPECRVGDRRLRAYSQFCHTVLRALGKFLSLWVN